MELATTLAAAVSALIVPWFATCGVLVVAGGAKLRRPDPTVGALRGAGLPSSRRLVQTLGAGEIALGSSSLVSGHTGLAVLVALTYVAFAVFVVGALRRGGLLQSCGCFGSPDVPASRLHVAVNLGLAGVAAGFAATTTTSLADVIDTGEGFLAIGLSLVAVLQLVVVLTVLPRTQARRLELREAFGW